MIAAASIPAATHYFQWGVIQISLANLLVIVAMIIVFILALVLPFPHSHAQPAASKRDQVTGSDPDGDN